MKTIEQITDDQLMQGLNQCDRCGTIEPSIELFWNIEWEEHTPRQLKVLESMQEAGLEAVCHHCFYEIAKGV